MTLTAALVLGPAGVAAGSADAGGTPAFAVDNDPFPHLETGDESDDVLRLQQRLADAGFYNHEIDGVFGRETASAVIAFHKYLGTTPTSRFSSIDWHLLNNLPDPGLPQRDNPDRVEVDIGRQILFVIRGDEIAGILPVSTGGGQVYWSVRNQRNLRANTPRGDFTLQWRQFGWATDRVTGWSVYKYWAFHPFYGIHGYNQVPTRPASHGCVRVHIWDSDWLDDVLFIGMDVHIWDTPPEPVYEPHPLVESALHTV